MNVNLEERPIAEQIKFLASYRGYTLKTLGEEFNRRFGTKYVQQSFSRKINNNAINWEELKQFGGRSCRRLRRGVCIADNKT